MKFSREVKKIISTSVNRAKNFNSEYVTPEHLFLGVIKSNDKVTRDILIDLGVDIDYFTDSLKATIREKNDRNGRKKISINTDKILKASAIEAKIFKSKKIEPYHLLAAILLDRDNEVTQQLESLRINYKVFASQVKYKIYTNEIQIVKSPLKFREKALMGRILAMKYFATNRIRTDRKIVEYMVNEIFVKRGTSSDIFQDKLYEFLDDCKVTKDEKEYNYLMEILKNKL